MAAAAGRDADPVPVPRRAGAQSLSDGARLRGQPAQAVAAGLEAAVCRDAASRLRDGGLGSAPRRTARAEALPPGGSAQERMAADRPRPADERRRRLHPDDSAQTRRTAPRLGAAGRALQPAAARSLMELVRAPV